MTKRARQGAMLRLIDGDEISTQSELAAALAEEGFDVAQTTVSRDLNELGVVKVRGNSGKLVYARPGTTDQDQMSALALALQRWVLTIDSSDNMVVIRTPNGYADPVAQAMDEAGHPGIVGTVAGENTVLVVAAEGVRGKDLAVELSVLRERGMAEPSS